MKIKQPKQNEVNMEKKKEVLKKEEEEPKTIFNNYGSIKHCQMGNNCVQINYNGRDDSSSFVRITKDKDVEKIEFVGDDIHDVVVDCEDE